jgi:hypothetical protein
MCDLADPACWPAGHCDAVLAVFLFNDLPLVQREGVLGGVRQALRPGGRFIFTLPHPLVSLPLPPGGALYLRCPQPVVRHKPGCRVGRPDLAARWAKRRRALSAPNTERHCWRPCPHRLGVSGRAAPSAGQRRSWRRIRAGCSGRMGSWSGAWTPSGAGRWAGRILRRRWRAPLVAQLERGRGVVRVTGLQGLEEEEWRLLFLAIGPVLGQPDRTYGLLYGVSDSGLSHLDRPIPVSQTRAATGMHTDSSQRSIHPLGWAWPACSPAPAAELRPCGLRASGA